ncbi:MAG TPA: cytochrome C, partial [Methylococcaceae bacterium]|nr:cytochrome C [Methylococcaceae bacterium]
APYWRVALQHDWNGQYLALGTFGLQANLYPSRDMKSAGTNQYTDLGADLTYQYLGSMEHIFEFRGSYIREHQQLDASRALGLSSQSGVMLNTLNVNGSYTFQQTYSANLGFVNVTGTNDPLLYTDYTSARPNSQWFVTEFDYVPFGKSDSPGGSWLNLRFALQYVAYTKFDGSTKNTGDNNTLFLSGWLAF